MQFSPDTVYLDNSHSKNILFLQLNFYESVLYHPAYVSGPKHWSSIFGTGKVVEGQEKVCLPSPSLRTFSLDDSFIQRRSRLTNQSDLRVSD